MREGVRFVGSWKEFELSPKRYSTSARVKQVWNGCRSECHGPVRGRERGGAPISRTRQRSSWGSGTEVGHHTLRIASGYCQRPNAVGAGIVATRSLQHLPAVILAYTRPVRWSSVRSSPRLPVPPSGTEVQLGVGASLSEIGAATVTA